MQLGQVFPFIFQVAFAGEKNYRLLNVREACIRLWVLINLSLNEKEIRFFGLQQKYVFAFPTPLKQVGRT